MDFLDEFKLTLFLMTSGEWLKVQLKLYFLMMDPSLFALDS